jgi:hypothetical protein
VIRRQRAQQPKTNAVEAADRVVIVAVGDATEVLLNEPGTATKRPPITGMVDLFILRRTIFAQSIVNIKALSVTRGKIIRG